MRRTSILLALLLATPFTATAQVTPPPPPEAPITAAPQPPPVPDEPPDDFDGFGRATRNAIRIGQDLHLAEGDAVRDALVVFGDATVAGEVDGNLVVVLGRVDLASTAILRGDFVSVGGAVTAQPGASARRDFVVVGGVFDGPAGFMPGGEHVVIGGNLLGNWIQGFVPYLTRGLLWGRLIVPDLPWVWGVVGLFFLLYLAINLLFEAPVRACAATLAVKPMTSFGAGLLVLLLVGPVCLLLAVSVIGIAVVPFVLFALLGGWIVGKVGVTRWMGMSIVSEDPPDSRAQATRSVIIGFVLLSIAYVIPVIGLAAWAIVGVLGLGASALSFLSAYRRENRKPAPSALDVPPPPVPATYSAPPPMPPPTAPVSPPSVSFAVPEPPEAMAYETTTGSGAAAAAIPLAAAPSVLATMPKALFRDRLAAFVLDIILLVLAVNILRADPDEMFFPLLLAYHVGMWTWKQTTVGGVICQLRLVRVDGERLTFADALVRGLSGIFSLAVLFIGALWILRDPDSQAWHDKVAGTYVVKVPRGWPL
jgi:uncharacterized RDD family membrane protein YckC